MSLLRWSSSLTAVEDAPAGFGKSVALFQLVDHCMTKDMLVVYVPNGL